jgi:hypothetical protein
MRAISVSLRVPRITLGLLFASRLVPLGIMAALADCFALGFFLASHSADSRFRRLLVCTSPGADDQGATGAIAVEVVLPL